MITEALYKRLHDDTTISGLVDTRIEPEASAQGSTLPRIVYSIDGKEYFQSLTGSTGGLCEMQVDIDCIASTFSGAHTLAEAVRQRLDRFHGQVVSGVTFDETINWARLDDETDHYDQPRDGGDKGVYWVRQTYTIWYGVSVPTGT